MRRLYGRLREAFGWSGKEIDALSMVEAEEIVEHWSVEPTVGDLLRAYFGVTKAEPARAVVPDAPFAAREVTEEEFAKIVRSKAAFAEDYGKGNRP